MNMREWALPVYTILMQLATGTLFVLWVIRYVSMKTIDKEMVDKLMRRPILVIFVTILIAVIGSHFHLSRPFQSFLAVLNFRSSWLSREIVFTVIMIFTSAALVDQIWKKDSQIKIKTFLGWTAILLGITSIYCMASIYLIPIQAPWNTPVTILMFYLSALVLGPTTAAALLIMDAIFAEPFESDLIKIRSEILNRSIRWLIGLATVAVLLIIFVNVYELLKMQAGDDPARTSLALLLELYQALFGIRFVFLLAGLGSMFTAGIYLLKKSKPLAELAAPIYLACLLVLIAEILGRFLFYATHVRIGV